MKVVNYLCTVLNTPVRYLFVHVRVGNAQVTDRLTYKNVRSKTGRLSVTYMLAVTYVHHAFLMPSPAVQKLNRCVDQ